MYCKEAFDGLTENGVRGKEDQKRITVRKCRTEFAVKSLSTFLSLTAERASVR